MNAAASGATLMKTRLALPIATAKRAMRFARNATSPNSGQAPPGTATANTPLVLPFPRPMTSPMAQTFEPPRDYLPRFTDKLQEVRGEKLAEARMFPTVNQSSTEVGRRHRQRLDLVWAQLEIAGGRVRFELRH